jgi:hypothetical protein
MLGWSWQVTRHLFIAVAVGASAGREAGHETHTVFPYTSMLQSTTNAVDRLQVDAEGYLRFGAAFGR